MEDYSRASTLKKVLLRVVLIVSITTVGIAAYLIYKDNFSGLTYSNNLFYAAMGFIAIGGLSAYGGFLSVNNPTYKYQSTVMMGSYENRRKIDDMLVNSSFLFCLRMILVGLLLLAVSALAHNIF